MAGLALLLSSVAARPHATVTQEFTVTPATVINFVSDSRIRDDIMPAVRAALFSQQTVSITLDRTSTGFRLDVVTYDAVATANVTSIMDITDAATADAIVQSGVPRYLRSFFRISAVSSPSVMLTAEYPPASLAPPAPPTCERPSSPDILVLGDSWAAFSGAILATYCRGASLTNIGRGGTTAAEWATGSQRHLIRTAFEANPGFSGVWMSVGGNDILSNPGCSEGDVTARLTGVAQNIFEAVRMQHTHQHARPSTHDQARMTANGDAHGRPVSRRSTGACRQQHVRRGGVHRLLSPVASPWRLHAAAASADDDSAIAFNRAAVAARG